MSRDGGQERRRAAHRREGADHYALRVLTKAAAAMAEPEPVTRAAALVWAAEAIRTIEQGDVTGAVRELARRILAERTRRTDHVPGPYSGT